MATAPTNRPRIVPELRQARAKISHKIIMVGTEQYVPRWQIVEHSIRIRTEAPLWRDRHHSRQTALITMGRVRNYLRTYRRRWHLTDEELAFLFGYEAGSIISRLERDERTVTLAVAYACQTIFGVEPRELFPAAFESMQESVTGRMHELRNRLLQSKPTQKTLAKLQLLQEALGRLGTLSDQPEV